MTRFLLVVLLLVFPGFSVAQQITVRSGDHGEFTRLVFNIPSETGWEITPSENSSQLRLSLKMESISFDTSTVFDRIPRTRVSALTAVPGEASIDIDLACDCTANAFVLNDSMLVVDVTENLVNGFEAGGREVAISVSPRRLETVPLNVQTDLAKIWLGPGARIGPKKPVSPIVFGLPLASQISDMSRSEQLSPNTEPKAEEVRGQIFDDVANAATQGLLDPTRSLARPPRQLDIERRGIDDHHELSTGAFSDALIIDRNRDEKGRISIGGRLCVPDKMLSFTKWEEDTSDVSLLLSTRRGAIFGEFDKVNSSVMYSYVKSLLYFGFGAEAREALAMMDDARNDVLVALTYLVDGDPDPSHFFQDQFACEGLAAVWAVIDGTGLSSSAEIDRASVVRGFELLPQHLREHLGPAISKNLADEGFVDIAKEILRRLERMTGEETQSIAFGKAKIDLLEGNEEKAAKSFSDLSISQGPDTAQAIVASVEISERAGSQIPERIVELSAAYSTELRNTEEGPELWEAHLKSLTVNGRFDDALDILNDVEGVEGDMLRDARNDVYASIFQRADDVSFLKTYFQELPVVRDTIQDLHLLAAADRLLKLGLPGAALDTLNRLSDPQLEHENRLLQAKSLLELSRPEEAEILLIGLKGQEVSMLRAVARSRMGDHDYARSIYAELGQEEKALVEAWLSGDWPRVSKTEGNPLSPAATMLQAEYELPSIGGVSLSDAEAMFSASSKSREIIVGMLDATRMQDPN